MAKQSIETFVAKVEAKHGSDKFDFSKSDY